MTQRVKTLAAKPGSLGLVPGADRKVKGENLPHKVVLWPPGARRVCGQLFEQVYCLKWISPQVQLLHDGT